jgi:Uma2 family endonuclease
VTCTSVPGQSDVVPEPEVVVEVLSRSTQGFDRGPKLDAYQQLASLKQYVLIAQEEIRVSVYERDDGDWRYRTLQDVDAAISFAVGGVTMTLAEIYERSAVVDLARRQSG